ncbi:MAG: Gfo/Idh/MocA family oxidoreductase [Phaeospirillum sp.]|nr:Gfo/Idh/MocA family oxidoreductase [Phaeospirillum sp.]
MASIPASSDPIRLALIGAGRWGRNYLRTLTATEGVALAAVASGNPDTAALCPPGCRLFTHWRAMLAAGGLDGVIIASPPASHAEIAEAVIRQGLAVLIEKPLTLDHGQALRLRQVAADHPVLIQVGHIHLAAPAWRRLKQLVDRIAPVRGIRAVAGARGPYRPDVGVLWDWGAHDVAMCLDIARTMPDRVDARLLDRRAVADGTAERISIRLGFGALEAEIVLGTDMDKTRRFELTGAGGTLVYDDLAPAKLTLDGQAVPIERHPPLAVQVQDFAAAIRAGSTDMSGLELGIAVVEILDRCQSLSASWRDDQGHAGI